jgi:hypothetical protein
VGIQKFRSFEEARRASWLRPGDPTVLLRMKRLGELWRGAPVRHGVQRFRSLAEVKSRHGSWSPMGPTISEKRR